MSTVLAAVFAVVLCLPPAVSARAEPFRSEPPPGAQWAEPSLAADASFETSMVASTAAPRVDGGSVAGSQGSSDDNPAEENDDRVPVELATFGAAVTVVVVLSAGYLLRRRLGLVKPPPAQDQEH